MKARYYLINFQRSVLRFRLRSLFMSVGIIIGITALVAGQSLGEGAGQQLSQRMNKMFGPGTIYIMSQQLGQADLDAIESQVDNIVTSAPRVTVGELDVSYQSKTRQSAVFGHAANAALVWSRDVIEGRYFTESDIKSSARVTLIGHRLAEYLFGDTDPIGESIMIGSVPFDVIGILNSQGIDPHGEDRDEDIYIPLTTAMKRVLNIDKYGTVKLLVNNYNNIDENVEQITDILREVHSLGPDEMDDFRIYTSKFINLAIDGANQTMKRYLLGAALLILVVAASVISSLMMQMVADRTNEIGLRMTLGATSQDIKRLFLFETITVTLLAGIIGMILGYPLAVLLSELIDVPVVASVSIFVTAIVVTIVIGVISSVWPAHKAAKKNIVDCLR